MESTDGVVPAPGPTNELTVLHVEDDPAFAELTRIHLERAREAMTVVTETDPAAAIEYLEANGTVDAPVDCIVSDYQMPGMDGLELLRAVREKFPSLPFVLFTGQGSEEVAADAFAADATDYLRKDSGSGATSSSNTASPTRGTVRGSASPSSAPSSRPTGGPSPSRTAATAGRGSRSGTWTRWVPDAPRREGRSPAGTRGTTSKEVVQHTPESP